MTALHIDWCYWAVMLGVVYLFAATTLIAFLCVHFLKRRWRYWQLRKLRLKFHRFLRRLLAGDYQLDEDDYFSFNDLLLLWPYYQKNKSAHTRTLLRHCFIKAGIAQLINIELEHMNNSQRIAMLELIWPFLTTENLGLLDTMLDDQSRHVRLAAKLALKRAGLDDQIVTKACAGEMRLSDVRTRRKPIVSIIPDRRPHTSTRMHSTAVLTAIAESANRQPAPSKNKSAMASLMAAAGVRHA